MYFHEQGVILDSVYNIKYVKCKTLSKKFKS